MKSREVARAGSQRLCCSSRENVTWPCSLTLSQAALSCSPSGLVTGEASNKMSPASTHHECDKGVEDFSSLVEVDVFPHPI